MALIFTDSFDNYSTVSQKGYVGTNYTLVSTNPRTGSKSLCLNTGNGNSATSQAFTPRQTVGFGQAIYFTQFATESDFWKFYESSSGNPQVVITMDQSGVFRARRGGLNGVLLGTGSLIMQPNSWHYLEALCTVSLTQGTVLVYLDNVLILALTGINTQFVGGNATISAIRMQEQNATGWFVDDFYILDDTGNQFNSLLGNVDIISQLPVANGQLNQFSRGGSTINPSNYQQVNENTPDDNTTYVLSNLVGAKEQYQYSPLTQTSGIVYGGMMWPRLEADDAGTRKYRAYMYSQGISVDNGSDIIAPSLSYTEAGYPFQLDPATGQQYTVAALNAAETGITIVG